MKNGRRNTKKHRPKSKNKSSQHRTESSLSRAAKHGQKPVWRERSDRPEITEDLKKARQKTEDVLSSWKSKSQKIQLQDVPTNPQMDPWQAEALSRLLAGENVVVDAPTTAGKTRVVEEFFKENIAKAGFRAAYTAPVKSLSNDKLREFSEGFGADNVGIATGDIKHNLDAPIVVATLESYRNSLLGVEPDLGRSLVIFDEYHFMQDSGRGSAWEEAIILTPPNCQLLLLSASVDNAEDFCSWIESLSHRPCKLVRTITRPVPLENLCFYREQWLLAEEVEKLAPRSQIKISKFPLEQSEIARRLKSVTKMGLAPCILYAGQRLSCESMSMELCKALEPLSREESTHIKEKLEANSEVGDATRFMKSNLRRMLIMYGVAYHHSGIAPQGRRAVEILVKEGALRFCVATMGLSIGINFSVRSTLISDYRRPGENGFTQYDTSEVLQMLGRAGRRGRDAVGFSLWPSIQSYYKFGGNQREECSSRLRNDPTTFLGLCGRGFKLRDIEAFYEKSFLKFQSKSAKFQLIRPETLRKHLKQDQLPCHSPAHELSSSDLDQGLCMTCTNQKHCSDYRRKQGSNSLSQLHLHLHKLGAMNDQETLTPMGDIARYFPQGGGLMVSKMISDEEITKSKLMACAELMAALSLARFKAPTVSNSYAFPFKIKEMETTLEEMYPISLFEELYDPANPRRDYPIFRDFNPKAGYIVKEWLSGTDWISLRQQVCHEKFAEGDLVNLLYRTSTYIQSLIQAKIPKLSNFARDLKSEILRPPLSPEIIKEETKEEDKQRDLNQ